MLKYEVFLLQEFRMNQWGVCFLEKNVYNQRHIVAHLYDEEIATRGDFSC